MNDAESTLARIDTWYRRTMPRPRQRDLPAKGNIAAALIVLERLKRRFDLSMSAHITDRGGQIAGMGPAALRRILERHGESRVFLREGGRTNRGNHQTVRSLLEALRDSPIQRISDEHRDSVLDQMQAYLVRHGVQAHLDRERIQFDYSAAHAICAIVDSILGAAKSRGQDGHVSQHLVGAKLEIRYRDCPDIVVPNSPASAADRQTGRAGDFTLNDTAFHVTVAPAEATISRCELNIRDGLSPVLLVPDDKLAMARGLVEQAGLIKSTSVVSIQSFVGQNITEVGRYSLAGRQRELAELLRVYNRRVDEAESDRSLFIELPEALRKITE